MVNTFEHHFAHMWTQIDKETIIKKINNKKYSHILFAQMAYTALITTNNQKSLKKAHT